MDARVKSFAAEAASRLGFLCTEYGFTGPDTVRGADDDAYPVVRTLRYRRGHLAVEISLILSYMGEEYVTATVVDAGDAGPAGRSQAGQGTAHTGYQMRRALDHQADALRRLVSHLDRHKQDPGIIERLRLKEDGLPARFCPGVQQTVMEPAGLP